MTEKIVDLYDSSYRTYDKWYDDNKFAYISEVEALKRVIPKKGEGLEIGVGTGRFAAPLGIRYGIDPSRKMIQLAKKRGVKTQLGFGECLPFADACFDYVAIINTLCFVENPRKTIAEAHRVIKTNGKLIVGFIDRDSFLGRTYRTAQSRFYEHANFLTVEEMKQLIEGVQFSLLSFYQTIFQLPKKILSVDMPKKGYGTGGFIVIAAEK